MNIAISINNKFTKYAIVMLLSLVANMKEGTVIHLFVLHSELSFDNQRLIKQLITDNGGWVDFILINQDMFPENMPVTEDWPLEIYYRLMLADILPADVDRILYLDVDVIINTPLDELYYMDFDGKLLCACESFGDVNFGEYRRNMFKEHLEKGLPYVESGLLLLNVEQLRNENYYIDKYLEVAKQFDYKLELPDMDLLNYTLAGRIKVIDKQRYQLFAMQSYNAGMRYDDAKKAMIVHYAGHKPWMGEAIHFNIEQLWWDYAKYTPFYHEFLEQYVYESINDPFVYNKIYNYTAKIYELKKEFGK